MPRRLPYLLLAGVLVGAFAFHAYRAEHPTSSYQSADERSYGKLAVNIADQRHYGDPSTRMTDPLHWPPGAPMLFAVGHALFPSADSAKTFDIPAAYWLQAVVALGTILASFGLGYLLAGPRAGLLAAALVGFYPPLILSTGEQLSEALGAFLLVSSFFVLALAARRSLTLLYLAGGALLGLAILTRADLLPVPLVLGPLVAVWTWRAAGDLRRGVLVGALIMGGAALAIAPWSIYASERAGELVPVTRGSSSALFVGTYLPGNGTTVGMKRALGAEAKRRNPRLRGIPDFELEARSVLAVIAARRPDLEPNAAIAAEARRNITRYAREDPVGFAGMMLNKVQRMWSRYARGGARHTSAVIRVWHILLVLAAVAGLIAGIVRRRSLMLGSILATVLVATAVHMLVVSQARYNLPLMPALIAGGVAGWVLFARGPRRSEPEDGDDAAGEPRTAPRPAARRLPSGAASG